MLGDWTSNRGLGLDYSQHECHEPITTGAIIKTLETPETEVFWDIGSAYGYFGIIALDKTSPSNIHLFEPDEIASSFISKNNYRYGDGQMTLNERPVGSTNGCLGLDEYYSDNSCPDIVKIDVDGQEEDILSTMTQTLDECQPELLIEIHFSSGYYERRKKIIELLSNFGYKFEICYRHRDRDSEWTEIGGIDNLPSIQDLKQKESALLGADYMLQGTPK